MTERIAIVGSRDYPDLDGVRAYVRSLPKGTRVVSGGARGVDRTAADAALDAGLTVVVLVADWEHLGKRAGFARNARIVKESDRVVAFWDGRSHGTAHTIRLARRAGKPVEIRRLGG